MKKTSVFTLAMLVTLVFSPCRIFSQQLKDFKPREKTFQIDIHLIDNPFQFNGYTNHWQDQYRHWYRYGGVFKMAVDDVQKNILQNKVDLAEDMGIPGFVMEEGFLNLLFQSTPDVLENPSAGELESALKKGDVLVYADSRHETGKTLASLLPDIGAFVKKLKSHQYGMEGLKKAKACILENGNRKLFVILAEDPPALSKIKDLIAVTRQTVQKYDMHKGWFGAYTLVNSVTCTPGHPLDVIGYGMNEGNDWFVFAGYMDFLLKNQLESWMKSVHLPVVTDVGTPPIYGCRDYDGLQVQDMTRETWIKYAHDKGGYVFRNVWDTAADPYHYDGYFAQEGNKEQTDNEKVPFVLNTGRLLEQNALSSMVLFVPKGSKFDRKALWQAILSRHEAGIFGKGKMTGPASFRYPLEMLLLDREYLENYFNDAVSIHSGFSGYTLNILLTNHSDKIIKGRLQVVAPQGIGVGNLPQAAVSLPPHTQKTVHVQLQPTKEVMGRAQAVAIRFSGEKVMKSTVSLMDLPPAISQHQLLYGHAPRVDFPVTVHNFTRETNFPVTVKVIDNHTRKEVFRKKETFTAPMAGFVTHVFQLNLKPGEYTVTTTALGTRASGQLGVGAAKGHPYLYPVDLNSDGIPEYRMENDSVRITLLATGARVIEYIVKSRGDNVLFKLWPRKPVDDKRPDRKWYYYPYGGFEDFLGQASMETHKIYQVKVIREKGDFVRVTMTADFYGNKMVKTFTLYGNSPLLEIRYSMTFKNPEANVLGPQPMLHLGKKHGTEDVFIIPGKNGLEKWHMDPDRYYGHLFFTKEGWNAGYDTREDISFVGAFPVNRPLFLHMWMNHPRNGDSHYYYAEFQPWVPIYRHTTTYFSYYLWGTGGPWENGVKTLRQMNLISVRKEQNNQ